MKKLITALMMVLLLSGVAFAEEWSFGSGQKTSTDNIVAGPGMLYGIAVATDGTNAVTLDIFDSSTPITSGINLFPQTVITTSATDRYKYLPFSSPIRFYKGLSVSPTCAGTYKYVIYYR